MAIGGKCQHDPRRQIDRRSDGSVQIIPLLGVAQKNKNVNIYLFYSLFFTKCEMKLPKNFDANTAVVRRNSLEMLHILFYRLI